jgi:predicted adenine nucleotide alpha hydrolase (AANH) superfamily ATPase
MQKYCGCVFSEEERYLKKYQKKSWFWTEPYKVDT